MGASDRFLWACCVAINIVCLFFFRMMMYIQNIRNDYSLFHYIIINIFTPSIYRPATAFGFTFRIAYFNYGTIKFVKFIIS